MSQKEPLPKFYIGDLDSLMDDLYRRSPNERARTIGLSIGTITTARDFDNLSWMLLSGEDKKELRSDRARQGKELFIGPSHNPAKKLPGVASLAIDATSNGYEWALEGRITSDPIFGQHERQTLPQISRTAA